MTAHGLRQLPATVSGCFVFSLSQKLLQCSCMLSRRPRPCRELYTWHAVGRVFCILFWSNFFLSCLWGWNKGEHTKGREGRWGNCFPHRYAEWKIVIRILRLRTSSTGKKKSQFFVWLVHAPHDFLFRDKQLNFTCVSVFRSAFVACAKGEAHNTVLRRD